MRSISSVFTALLIVAALMAPSALARPAQDPVVTRHDVMGQMPTWPAGGDQAAASSVAGPATPTWPVDPQPIARTATQPVPSDDGFPWATVGIVLVAAAVGLTGAIAVVRMRRRTHLPA